MEGSNERVERVLRVNDVAHRRLGPSEIKSRKTEEADLHGMGSVNRPEKYDILEYGRTI